jgi:hypothetical protein
MSVRNAFETDLVSLHFALKGNILFAKPAHPNLYHNKETQTGLDVGTQKRRHVQSRTKKIGN